MLAVSGKHLRFTTERCLFIDNDKKSIFPAGAWPSVFNSKSSRGKFTR